MSCAGHVARRCGSIFYTTVICQMLVPVIGPRSSHFALDFFGSAFSSDNANGIELMLLFAFKNCRGHTIPTTSMNMTPQPTSTSMNKEPFCPYTEPIPEEFICPLTLDIMKSPMMNRAGHSFERHDILEWLKLHGSCPLTRQPMHLRDLVPNARLAQRIRHWVIEHPEEATECETSDEEDDDDPFALYLCPMVMSIPTPADSTTSRRARRAARSARREHRRALDRLSSRSSPGRFLLFL
jgi:hypothetical protein